MRIAPRWGLCLCLCFLALPRAVLAESGSVHHLLAQPHSYTNVLDAFDGDDLPDISVSLAFRRTHSFYNIARETTAAAQYRQVARAEQLTNGMSLELASGIYRDLMVLVRLPILLSDKRKLSQPPDADRLAPEIERENASDLATAHGDAPLFLHNNQSATRSGIPGIELAAAWGVTNQYRTAYLPTWVVMLESKLGFGSVLKPCLSNAPCEAGVSRGTVTLALDSRWSYRYSWLEPYLGLRYMLEWATQASGRFTPDGVPDDVDTSMPRSLDLTLGAAVMAWEDRARFQRISVDVRGQAAYSSSGRDYSPLFDALGTSSSSQLGAAARGTDIVPFRGLTQVDAYAQLRAELALAAQAARYVQFRLGMSLMHMTPHLLTGAAACATSAASPCDGQKNPLYRAVIDLPGQRFLLLGNVSYDLFASATGQF
jgi:hypothetical protein